MKRQFIIAIVTIFIVLTGVFIGMRSYMPLYPFAVLETGNVIMAALSLLAYLLVDRQINSRPQAFIRGVSGASFLKLMVCMVSITAYIAINRSHIHKPTVFVLFGIYAVYTITETWLLSKLVRDKQ
jgi:membrane-bound acyltransferase YfiQ involved in biofilm formation